MKTSKLLLFLFIGMFLISFASSTIYWKDEVKQGECIDLDQSCPTCTYVNITMIQYPNGTSLFDVYEMDKNGNKFNYTFCNTTLLGNYHVTLEGDKDNVTTTEEGYFDVTINGETLDTQTVLVQIILISFFISLGFIVYFVTNKVDLEKWNNSILKKYQNRNYVKLVLSSIGYNLLKNSFIIYYLIGFPILTALVEISYAYSLLSLLEIFKVIMIVYSIGVILIGIVFFSYVQEWVIDLLEQVKNECWGITNG